MLAVEKLNSKLKSKWKWLAGSLLVLGLLVGYQFYFAGSVEVEAASAVVGTIGVSVEEVGYIQADEEYDVLAPVNGYIGQQYVELGQEVDQSQTLIILDSPDTDLAKESSSEAVNKVVAELRNARHTRQVAVYDLADAERNLVRNQNLLSTGAISQFEYDGSKLTADRLRSQAATTDEVVVSLEQQLVASRKQQAAAERKTEQMVIKSPVAGTVLVLPLKTGQLAVMGSTLAKIGQKGPTKVYVDIISDDMRYVTLGQKVTVSSPALEKPLTGIISQIYPQAYEKTSALGVQQRRVRVIADLERRENLRSGYEVKATIDTQSRDNVLLVPREAISLNPQGEYEVWVINKQQQAESRKVKVGLKNRLSAEICEGLQAGDIVIVGKKGQIGEKLVSESLNTSKKTKKILIVYENMGSGHLRMARILQGILVSDEVELLVLDGEGISGSAAPDFCVKAWNWLLKKDWLRFQDVLINYLLRLLFVPIVEATNNTATLQRMAVIAPDIIICVCDGYSRVLGEYAREHKIPFYQFIVEIGVCFDLVNRHAVHCCYFTETATAVQSYPLDASYYAKNLTHSTSWQEKASYVFRFYYDFIWQRRKNMFYRNRETELAEQNDLPCQVIGPLAEEKYYMRFDKKQLRQKYHLQPDVATVLIVSGGQGGQYLRTIVEVLVGSYHFPLNVLVMCGYDTDTFETLQACPFSNSQIKIIPVGHTNCFHEYLSMADCAIIRPSASTFVECLLQRTPVIIPYLTLSNDLGAMMMIRRYHIGEVYDRRQDIPATLATVLVNKNYYDTNLELLMKQYPDCYEQQRTNLRHLVLGKEG